MRGKEAILFRLAEAAVAHPDDTVRAVVFPVVGEKTLRELVREAKANEHAFQARSARCCAARTPTTTGGCCRRCSPRWTSAVTTPPTGR